MATFGHSTGFGSPARSDGPRTVTYGADTITQAQHASARLGSRVIAMTLGAAALLLAGVAMLMSWAFVASLAVTWGEVFMLCAVATGLVGAMCGLPVASALLGRSYPIEARRCMQAWLVAMLAMAVAAAWAAGRLEPAVIRDKSVKTLSAPLGQPAVKSRWMTTAIWKGSDGCTKPRTDYDAMTCEEYEWTKGQLGVVEPPRGTVAEAAPWDLSPAATLGIAGIGDGLLRRVLVLFLNLAAVAGAGILGRWSVLATAESYRLGEGQAAALPSIPQMPAAPASSAGPVIMQQDAFSMWASGRLIQESGATVRADALLADFQETCRLNNLPLQTSTGDGLSPLAWSSALGDRRGRRRAAVRRAADGCDVQIHQHGRIAANECVCPATYARWHGEPSGDPGASRIPSSVHAPGAVARLVAAWLLWTLNDPVSVAEARRLSAGVAKQCGGVPAVGEALPLPGTKRYVATGVGLVARHQVRTLPPLQRSYRIVGGALMQRIRGVCDELGVEISEAPVPAAKTAWWRRLVSAT